MTQVRSFSRVILLAASLMLVGQLVSVDVHAGKGRRHRTPAIVQLEEPVERRRRGYDSGRLTHRRSR